jgi:hypothetical protein
LVVQPTQGIRRIVGVYVAFDSTIVVVIARLAALVLVGDGIYATLKERDTVE